MAERLAVLSRRTGWRLPARRRRAPVLVIVAGCVLAAAAGMMILPGVAPHDPEFIDGAAALQGPSPRHWLGTDELGRDVFSRIVAGARTGLLGPLILALGTTVLAILVAVVAGYAGGRTDAVIGRVIDVLYAVPPLVVAIVVVGITGGGWWTALAVLLVFGLPMNMRLLRSAVIVRVRLPYVEAARTAGLSSVRIMVFHLLPAVASFVVAVFFLTFTYGIVDLSAMSFLGLGVPPGSSDWGRMIAENRAYLLQNAWATIGPTVAVVLVAVSANVVGDWIHSRYESHGRTR
ncbi:ABC transporter permease [Actinomadura sp. 7K507]|uniref:ABC transporter permease n=1 Tax=Actinomadura sp. 7K507 TaxID=2530365 RepID=UPI0010485B90|nr:ABC transporter permease [Actinomadura sp. 7K507]TDC73834.1 ABC transporter permease [Actinomadura sp. 7K507]